MRKGFLTVLVLMLLTVNAVAQVRFDSASIEPSYVEPGDDVQLNVKFSRGLTTRDLFATQTRDGERIPLSTKTGQYYFAQLTPKDFATRDYVIIKQGLRPIGSMASGESWSAPFDVHVADNCPITDYTLVFRLLSAASADSTDYETVLSHDITLTVNGNPKFSITSDNHLSAGQTANFKMRIANVGGGTARHVSVTLNATNPMTVLKSSSSYLGSMDGDTFRDLTYAINVESNAKPGAYTIPVDLKYVGRDGVEETIRDSLGVKIISQPIVEAYIESADKVVSGKSGKVSVSIVNRGFVDAKFLSVGVLESDDYDVVGRQEVYIGNIASDDFESEEFTIKPAEGVSGKIPLTLRVSFTDENTNERVTLDGQDEIQVMSVEEYQAAHPTSSPLEQVLSGILTALAVALGLFILWFALKLWGFVTGLIDRRLFRKR
jgi:hypothetical protein